jgi:hypothetical protein
MGVIAMAAAALLAAGTSGCSGIAHGYSAGSDSVYVGVAVGLQTPSRYVNVFNGVQLALDELNASRPSGAPPLAMRRAPTDVATSVQVAAAFRDDPSVVGVVGQRLVRRVCRSCAVPFEPSVEELEFYEQAGGPPGVTFYQGEGCNFCFRTGYEDRIGVYELLRITVEMKQLLMRKANHDEIQALAIEQGMRSLRDGGIQLVADGVTTISEVIRSLYTI